MSDKFENAVSRWSANARTWKIIFLTCWGLAVAAGFGVLWHYSLTPGTIEEPPAQWPADSQLRRAEQGQTLVLFVHPRCPCTQATVGELARIMSQCQQRVSVYVLLLRPVGATADWEDTALGHQAKDIPGVQVQTDWDGVEARRFRAKTSGMCVLYDTAGRLVFHGGITTSRGHAGDNDGANAVVAFVTTGESTVVKTHVFGCPIIDERKSNKP